MKYLLLTTFFFLSCLPLWAQENSIELSEKQQKNLEKIKDADQRQKLLKKYWQQDSTKVAKEIKQLKDQARQTVMDSLKARGINLPDIPTTAIDTTTIDEVKSIATKTARDSLNNYVNVDLENVRLDSATTDDLTQTAGSKAKTAVENELNIELPPIAIDSAAADKITSKAKLEAAQALEGELGTEIPEITIDSTTINKLENEAEKRVEAALQGTEEGKALAMPDDSGFAELENHKRKLEQTQEEIRQAAASKELKQKMTAQAKQYITENADKIQQVQAQMGKLKQKYSYMPNSNDLSSAVKRSSLEGESLWKRLVVGGNFNVSRTNPVTIDLSPVVGYKFNKLFEAGITGSFRTQFSADKSGLNQDKEAAYGYSVFANHMVFKNFFGYLEGENMHTGSHNPEIEGQQWVQTLLLGIGRKFMVAKWLEMQALVLFNILHDNQDALYNSPVVFKTAVRLRK